MLTVVNTNLFDSPAGCLTNPVNTDGVMGKGLALQFKKRFPALEAPYRAACQSGLLTTQHPLLWHSGSRYILCLATKIHWRHPSRLEYVAAGLEYIVEHESELPFTTLSLPLLGCGLGGLSPDLVIPLIESYLAPLALASTLHLPQA